ncbi:MAG: dephospho-CoA kinase, partial [Elusimicrobia bacterium]|nr:dephospho-CoA kinase [Elusimicrobiota bacterium]
MRALRIGLTGGLGAGKSLALRALSGWGAATIDADQIAREQAAPGGPAYRRIVAAFGPSIVGRGGALDRAKLARL